MSELETTIPSPEKPRRDKPARPIYLLRHRSEPDFSREPLEIAAEHRDKLLAKLSLLYGEEKAVDCYAEVERLLQVYHAYKTPRMIEASSGFDVRERFSQQDVVLITYGDLVLFENEPPIRVLGRMLQRYARHVNTIHLLPFFPYSSDRGFSVINYTEVDPRLGSWEDVAVLSKYYRLMFDGVFNHVSAQSRWFQEFRHCNPEYLDFFTTFSSHREVSKDHLRLILRPRASKLLTPYRTLHGRRYVWTTFSPDQIDLNFQNPKVLERMLEVLLRYVRRGADVVRLDAATYLWCELGTSCAHLQETHALVQFFRAALDVVAPQVSLVTETNVPHADNVSYFGDGTNEAQMVYNFALPPLVLLAFQTGDATHLSRWAATLEKISDTATYFNFLDSHDGVGLLPIKDLVPPAEVEAMIERAREHGGLISYRTGADGEKSPYEINVTWWSALNRDDAGEDVDFQVERFVASRAIALALRGVPGIYIASMVGSKNDLEAVSETGENRAINRQAIRAERLVEGLEDPTTRISKIFWRMDELLKVRRRQPAFHPNGGQRVLVGNPSIFALLRTSPDESQALLALVNVTDARQSYEVEAGDLGEASGAEWRDLFPGNRIFKAKNGRLKIAFDPYQVRWLVAS